MSLFRDTLHDVLSYMRQYKSRTFMTMFGIIWGTMTVILLLSFGVGVRKMLSKSMHGIGEGIAICWPGATSIPYEGYGRDRRIRLTDDDVEYIRENPLLHDADGLGRLVHEVVIVSGHDAQEEQVALGQLGSIAAEQGRGNALRRIQALLAVNQPGHLPRQHTLRLGATLPIDVLPLNRLYLGHVKEVAWVPVFEGGYGKHFLRRTFRVAPFSGQAVGESEVGDALQARA